MSNLYHMYHSKIPTKTAAAYDKNPNRVAGGLRGHGADHFTMLGEDGAEQKIPSHKYVQALEERIKLQDQKINILERNIRSLKNDIRMVQSRPSVDKSSSN